MLGRIDFTTKSGQKLTIPMYDGAEGFFFDSVEGIDPVKAEIVSSSFANVDGDQYQSARRGSRNLVFKMGVDVSQVHGSVTALRRRLMSYLMPKSEVAIRLFDDEFPDVDIVGIVESFDWPLFVQEPDVTLSIICHESDFIDLTTATFLGKTQTSLIEMPLDYHGSIEAGFRFRMETDRSLDGFVIYHRSPEGTLSSLEFDYALISGDSVEICTISGEKEITLTRAGTKSSIMYAMSPYSNWIELYPGKNQLSVVTGGTAIDYTLEYTNRYGGL